MKREASAVWLVLFFSVHEDSFGERLPIQEVFFFVNKHCIWKNIKIEVLISIQKNTLLMKEETKMHKKIDF